MSSINKVNIKDKIIIPPNYISSMNIRETEAAILFIKYEFQQILSTKLNLSRVSAPLFVRSDSGINDSLNETEKPITYSSKNNGDNLEIVQSLAKWKRLALAKYNFKSQEGIYTDMNAIRPDEELDNTHSLYVDQWDWEKIIDKNQRNIEYLKDIVKQIYSCIKIMEEKIHIKYPQINKSLPEEIYFIHSEELEELYPYLSPEERENKVCQQHGATFIIGIGGTLNNGKPHDGRSPDYDDWSTHTYNGFTGLNGDIIVWNPILNKALELSSMGIRVDPETLRKQLKIAGQTEKEKLPFHKKLLNNELPQTVGGGIGQSRLCMFFLKKAHIGEVQSSAWPNTVIEKCKQNNIELL